MKKKLIIPTLCVILCVSISIIGLLYTHNQKPSMTAEQISTNLKEANIPIDNVIVYTEETDVNKLLGRPNQYISKVNFADTRLKQYDIKNPKGGSIETFKNTKDLKARKAYIESVTKASPLYMEYIFDNGKYLLRLDKDLTNDQVNKYKEAFMSIK